MNLKAILEAMIFVAESPLSLKKMKEVLEDVEEREIVRVLEDLEREFREREGGVLLRQVAGGYHFRTTEETAPWVTMLKGVRPLTLSQAALETLAVVAYRQPIIKSEIERIRGVDVSGTLKGLLEKNLVRIMGRKDVPGRPIIYGTGRKFLEVFGLKDLSELPTLKEIEELEE